MGKDCPTLLIRLPCFSQKCWPRDGKAPSSFPSTPPFKPTSPSPFSTATPFPQPSLARSISCDAAMPFGTSTSTKPHMLAQAGKLHR